MMNDMPADESFPFRQFILKLHSRCNLACDHCYVYTKADQRWRARPRVMSRSVIEQSAVRVAEHVLAHGLAEVEVVLHGGEPLLAGPDAITHLVTTMRATVPARVRATVQTNATLLDVDYLSLFRALDVGVGVSVDGDERANDRHRVWPDGRGSHRDVRIASARLASEPYRGRLPRSAVHGRPRQRPGRDVRGAARAHAARRRLPAAARKLDHTAARSASGRQTRYADWLIAVFDRWYAAPRRETNVRLFSELVNVLLGGHSRAEGLGLAPAAMVVVETDGSIEQSDVLAAAFEGAAATGLHVATDSFDAALRLPQTRARQGGLAALCATCRACAVRTACGGGLRAHRYRAPERVRQPVGVLRGPVQARHPRAQDAGR